MKMVSFPLLFISDNKVSSSLLHESSGNVYCIQANKLYVFWGGDLNNVTVKPVPHKALNGGLVQSNGMLVTQDGLIVIKQWNFQIEDSLLITSSKENIVKLILSIGIVCGTILYFKHWKRENRYARAIAYTTGGALCGVLAWVYILNHFFPPRVILFVFNLYHL